MPVVVFTLQLSGIGSQRLFVTENISSVDYSIFVKWFAKVIPTENISNGLSKDQLQALCSLASTEKDRKLIKVAACQSKGLSGKKATEQFGIHNLPKLQEVEAALSQAEDICSAVNELAQAKEKATLEALGIYIDEEDSNDSENENEDSEQDVHVYWSSDKNESRQKEIPIDKNNVLR